MGFGDSGRSSTHKLIVPNEFSSILGCSQLRVYASALDPDTARISISSFLYLYTIIVVRHICKLLLQHSYIRQKILQTRGLSHKSDA